MENSEIKKQLSKLKEKFKNHLIELRKLEEEENSLDLTHYDNQKIRTVRRLLIDAIEMLNCKYR